MTRARKIAFGLVTGVLTCGFLTACSGDNVAYRPSESATFDCGELCGS